jgi:hypothetical protein
MVPDFYRRRRSRIGALDASTRRSNQTLMAMELRLESTRAHRHFVDLLHGAPYVSARIPSKSSLIGQRRGQVERFPTEVAAAVRRPSPMVLSWPASSAPNPPGLELRVDANSGAAFANRNGQGLASDRTRSAIQPASPVVRCMLARQARVSRLAKGIAPRLSLDCLDFAGRCRGQSRGHAIDEPLSAPD